MEVIEQVRRTFAGVERPTNEQLLHAECADDMDLEALYDIARWEDMADADIEGTYSALSFLSPEGFRYFIPAYLIYCVRNPESAAAVIDSTIWSFFPDMYDESLRAFVASKFSLLDDGQRDAVGAVLEFMVPHQPDAGRVLEYWRSQ